MNIDSKHNTMALVDFHHVSDSEREGSLDQMATILIDDELYMIRKTMLSAVAEAAETEGYSREPKDLEHAIRIVGELGIWDAFEQDNDVDFEMLASIFNDSDALTRTRKLFLGEEIAQQEKSPKRPKSRNLTELIEHLLDVSPDDRGVRYDKEENVYLFECKRPLVQGGPTEAVRFQSLSSAPQSRRRFLCSDPGK